MRARGLLLALLATMLLSGCVRQGGGVIEVPIRDEQRCSLSAWWREPGLYDALPAAAEAAGVAVHVGVGRSASERALPDELVPAKWAGSDVFAIEWRMDGSTLFRIFWISPKVIEATMVEGPRDERALPAFRALVEQLGVEEAATREEWERRFEMELRQYNSPRAAVAAHIDVAALARKVAGDTPADVSSERGSGELRWDAWTFRLTLSRHVAEFEVDGRHVSLTVDVEDEAYASVMLHGRERYDPRPRERLALPFEALGLPLPRFDGMAEADRFCLDGSHDKVPLERPTLL